jgi:hypothetical protein
MQLNKAFSQSECGVQQYYNLGDKQRFEVVPIAYFQTAKHWYFEGRYNFEASNCMSAYIGKVYERKSNISYSLIPVAGLVMGSIQGGSAGLNITADYKKVSFTSQCQYTFSIEDKQQNFTYSWSELSYNITSFFGAGISLQQTGEYDTKNKFDKGAFLQFSYNHWTLPFYVFDKGENGKHYILSLIYEWTHTTGIRNINKRNYINNKVRS